MNEQSRITPDATRFPLTQLVLSTINPRQHVEEAEIAELAESIWTAGLIQNLAGIETTTGEIAIVAGGRRLRALQFLATRHDDLAQTRPELANPPVRIAPDLPTAQAWALAENAARRDLHPADEIRAYGKMAQSGAQVSTIARAFAVSEKHVQRRLALAGLPEAVLAALAANEISLGMAAAFTISTDEVRSLEVLELCKSRDWSEHQIRKVLKPEAVKASDRRACFVGLEAYQAAGGHVSRDLFAQDILLDDPEILDTVFAEKLAALAEDHRGAGWKWVETSFENYIGYYQIEEGRFARLYQQEGALSEDDTARFDELTALDEAEALDAAGREELAALQAILEGSYSAAQKAHSGLILYVDPRGVSQICAGLVRKEDKAAAIAAGLLTASQHGAEDTPKSPISQKLRDDLDRVAQGARQHAVLRDPDLLLDLLAFHLSHALHWQKPFGISLGEVPNWPTTGAEGYALDPRLAEHPARDMQGKDLAKSFRAFRQKGSEYIRGELTRFLAAQYHGG